MPWIEEIAPGDADGELAELYRDVASPDGQVDAVLRVHSLRPRTLRAHLELYVATLHRLPNELSRRERELVGTVVSALNGCEYCVVHHRAGLARHLEGGEEAARGLVREALEAAGREADASPVEEGPELTSRERELVRYAAKLTERPGEMEPADLDPLRSRGLSDRGILDLNQVVSYFAYVNRTVLGLGVRPGGEALGLHPEEDADGLGHR